MKKIGEVSPPFGWRAWPALIDEDSECCRAQRRLLTTRCHRYIIGDKSNEGQDASLRIEMGNVGLRALLGMEADECLDVPYAFYLCDIMY